MEWVLRIFNFSNPPFITARHNFIHSPLYDINANDDDDDN